MGLDRSSHNKLNRHTAERFPSDSLFDRVARTVCRAECLPRKELYESWECARRIRRRLRGGPILEIAGGHGLLSMLLILLDDRSPGATIVDVRQPRSFERVRCAMAEEWPRLEGRIEFVEGSIEDANARPETLVVSVHACGALTDRVLDLAITTRSRVAVLPCCHDLIRCDTGHLTGWVEGPLAVDLVRAGRLRGSGYRVRTARIPEDITPHNRLLLGWPES